MLLPLLIIGVLELVNAYFVVAEFAIVGMPRSAIDARAERHDRLAKLVQTVLDDPQRKDLYIATAQIGITVASLGLGMYGEHVIADWILEALGGSTWALWLAAHGFASIVAVAVLTYFHIVIREILGQTPRTRYPIYQADLDHIVGTYHIKDLLRLLLNGQAVTASGARPAPVVPETALLDTVLATMRRERAQFAVVIDEHGGTS